MEPNEGLANSGDGYAEPHAATMRSSFAAIVSRQEGRSTFFARSAGSDGVSHNNSGGDSKRDGDGSDSIYNYGLADEGVLPQDLPVQQGSHYDSEGNIKHALAYFLKVVLIAYCGAVLGCSGAVCDKTKREPPARTHCVLVKSSQIYRSLSLQ